MLIVTTETCNKTTVFATWKKKTEINFGLQILNFNYILNIFNFILDQESINIFNEFDPAYHKRLAPVIQTLWCVWYVIMKWGII